MTNNEKKLMFDQVRMDIRMAESFAMEMNTKSSITPSDASELLRRCTKANSSCQAFERAMQGVEPPKIG